MLKYAGIIAVAIALIAGTDVDSASNVKWSKATYEKQEKMIKMGYPKNVATALINECKSLPKEKDPANCVLIGASILAAESSYGTNCTKHGNCFGMEDGATKYKSKEDGVKDWVRRYAKFWFNQKTPDSFYSNTPKRIPITNYCIGGSAGYCKHGHKNAWAAFNKLK